MLTTEQNVPSDGLSLPEALRAARQAYGVAPSYHMLWAAIVRGDIPAERVGARYAVLPDALPAIAELARRGVRGKAAA